jgi:uncharacterized protein YodC (DUF2158 family)
MEELKAGSVVCLKSGGPNMTVEFMHKDQADCKWFVNMNLFTGMFYITSLTTPETTKDQG